MWFKIIIVVIVCFAFYPQGNAQNKMQELSLEQVIAMAINNSIDIHIAKTKQKRSEWQYHSFLASQKPLVSLDATAPAYTSRISNVQQNDGTYKYLHQSNLQIFSGLSISQKITSTGGSVFFSSDFYRFDVFSSKHQTSFLNSPFYFGINQPVFDFNPGKWNKKLEPTIYKETQLQYIEQSELIKVKAVELYFEALSIQQLLKNLEFNSHNSDTLFEIGKERIRIGSISESELMQLEISALKAKNEWDKHLNMFKNRIEQLLLFLNHEITDSIYLQVPEQLSFSEIDENKAIIEALANRHEPITFYRRLLEMQMQLDKAKKQSGLNMNIYANYGITKNADKLNELYNNFENQKIATIGVSLPILDWGEAKGKIKMAEAELELEKEKIEQEKNEFRQLIKQKVREFNLQQKQIKILFHSLAIAKRNFELNKQRYLASQCPLLELIASQNEKDLAEQALIEGKQKMWILFFEIRNITLYDFIENKKL